MLMVIKPSLLICLPTPLKVRTRDIFQESMNRKRKISFATISTIIESQFELSWQMKLQESEVRSIQRFIKIFSFIAGSLLTFRSLGLNSRNSDLNFIKPLETNAIVTQSASPITKYFLLKYSMQFLPSN